VSLTELRAEVIAWLRSGVEQIDASSLKELLDLIHAEFVEARCFIPREAFVEILRELHQEPAHDWTKETQTWKPRLLRLDFYAGESDAEAAL
jgi:hypothetical protein